MGQNNICMSLFWVIILCILVYPLAFVTSFLWIALQPLEACCDCLRSINKFLERIVTWPRDFGYAIKAGTTNCPQP